LKKLFKVSFFVVLLLQVSIMNVLVGSGQSPQTPKQNEAHSLPDIYIDLSSEFRELGYTPENISSVSKDLVMSVLLSYCEENPFGYETEPPPYFDPENMNLFSEDDSVMENSVAPKVSPQGAGTRQGETKACVTCVVWDYPGDKRDLGGENGWIDSASDDYLYPYASDYGDYDLVFNELDNEVATRGNLTFVLDYFFENYDNVDLYFMGHGSRLWVYIMGHWWLKSFYCPYDSIYSDTGGINTNKVFWEYELVSYAPSTDWDSSPMRLVMLTCCRGWGFKDEALDPGGSTSHDRAFAGKNGKGVTDYTYYYIKWWCHLWYYADPSWDSSSAAAEANEYAWENIEIKQGTNMTYADTGTAIWK
jgi:hypothetical protein